MLYKSGMRRGISLEVIVEEDDNAEVSFDPRLSLFENESDSPSPSSSSTSSSSCLGPDGKEEEEDDSTWNEETDGSSNEICSQNNFSRLREEKEKRRQKKETDERWRRLDKQRSLSCETLTILDVGDDVASQEQWEEEARNWNLEDEDNFAHINHSISRRKILQSSLGTDDSSSCFEDWIGFSPDQGDEEEHDGITEKGSDNEEHVEEEEKEKEEEMDEKKLKDEQERTIVNDDYCFETKIDFDEEDEEEEEEVADASEERENSSSENPSEEVYKEQMFLGPDPTKAATKYLDPKTQVSWNQDSLSLDEIDTWITVGELEGNDDLQQQPEEINQPKEVAFSEETKTVDNFVHDDFPNSNEKSATEHGTPDSHDYIERETASGYSEDVIRNHLLSVETGRNSEDVIRDHLLSVETGRNMFDGRVTSSSKPDILAKLASTLQPPNMTVVEKIPPQDLEERNESSPFLESITMDNKLQNENEKNCPHIIHNKEVYPEELPPPRIVASVRQLFECLPKSTTTFHTTLSPDRFDHVRSNPSSKILRYDRDKHERSSGSKWASHSCSTTTPLHSPSSPDRSGSSISVPLTSKIHLSQPASEETNRAQLSGQIPIYRSATISLRPSRDLSAEGIYLRKPKMVSKFNVQKALQENPRYFHIRRKDILKEEGKPHNHTEVTYLPRRRSSQETNQPLSNTQRQQTVISSMPLRCSRDTIDRSDAESLSSVSSEDSGVVTKEFNSSILSRFSSGKTALSDSSWHRRPTSHDKFGSDPSFKWINPAVLAKIRAVGTTVIYFGPRHNRTAGFLNKNKTRKEGRAEKREEYEEALPRNKKLPEEWTEGRGLENVKDTIMSGTRKENTDYGVRYTKEVYDQQKSSSEIGPRIVGVLRKKDSNCETGHEKRVNRTEQRKRFSVPFSHDVRNPVSNSKLPVKAATQGTHSVIYDFTRK